MRNEKWTRSGRKKMRSFLIMLLVMMLSISTIPPLTGIGNIAAAATSSLDSITTAHYPLNSTYQYANRLNPQQQLSGSQVVWRSDYVSLVNPGNANDGHIAISANPGDPVTGRKIGFSLNIKLNSVQTRATSSQNTLFAYGSDNDNNLTLRPYYDSGLAAVVLKRNGTDEVAATFPLPAMDMWHNYAISLDGTPDTGKLIVWVDGVKAAEVPSNGIGADEIGNGHFRLNRTIATFSNLDSHYRDVRVFHDVLEDEHAGMLANEIRSFTWQDLLASKPLVDDQIVRSNLSLIRDPHITWISSDDSIINAETGAVTRPAKGSSAQRVTLTLHWFDFQQDYSVLVMPFDAADHLIADFHFDDDASGLIGGGARATVQGTASYVESFEGNGRAANLGSNFWLNVTKEDGSPLLAGLDEITISYDSKPSGGAGWTFFAAPNPSTQTYLSERYVGILDRSDAVTVERYHNQGARPPSASASNDAGWKHVDVVISHTDTKLYIDGELKAVQPSSYALTDILSETGGILQVGKGNWGSGEYYIGLIDNLQIFDQALSLDDLIEYRVTNIPPVITPSGGGQIYTPVTIKHPAGDRYIYYTTDGSEPTLDSTPYTGPFTVHEGVTVKAAAIAPNGNQSEVVSMEYYGSEWAATALEFRLADQTTVNNVKISWPIIEGADFYEVYRGDRLIGRVTGDVIDEYGLELGQDYVYTVQAWKDGTVIASASSNSVRTFSYDPSAIQRKKDNVTGAEINLNPTPEPSGIQVGGTWYRYEYQGERNAAGVVTTSLYERTSADGIHYGDRRLLGSFTDMRVEMEGYTYHPLTGRVVFHAHEEASSGYGRAHLFLASVTPGGDDFQATFRGRPFDIDSRDMTFFVDEDHTAYVLFAGQVNSVTVVAKLDANWEQPAELVNMIFQGKHKESPAVIKHDGRYYFYGSTANGWYPSQAEYASAESMDGTWTPLRPLGNGSTYATQGNGIWKHTGDNGRELFLANGYHWGDQYVDNFKDPMGTYSRQFPVVFHKGIATGDWFHQLDVDAQYGIIPVQSGHYLSLGKSAVDSHGLPAVAVTDGADLASSPRVQHSSLPYHIVIDLEQPSRLSEINLTTRVVLGSDAVYRYTLEGSQDNVNWTLLFDGAENNVVGFITHPIDDSEHYRYVRLTVHEIINVHTNHDATWADGIIELAVFGTAYTDKSELQAIVDEKKNTDRGTYTQAAWNTIRRALDHAEELLADDTASQWTVDRAAARIEWAFHWAQHVQPHHITDYASFGVPVGETWYDTEGNPIQAHGGGFLQQIAEDGKPIYYWVGENKIHNSAVFHAVSLYSSRDLVNWTYEGNIIDPFTETVEGAEYTLVDNKWERPKLLYNEKTKKYVLWGHWETAGNYASSQVVVATADHVAGPYTVLGHWRPGGTLRNWRSEGGLYMDSEYYKSSGIKATIPSTIADDVSQMGYVSRDFTVFVDDDGTAYLVSAEGHSMRLHRLNEEYTDVDLTTYPYSDPTAKATDFESYNFYEGDGREAPAVVRADDGYYMATSGQSGWLPNQGVFSYTADLTDPAGWTPVSQDGLILERYTFGNNSTFYSQPTNIMKLVDQNGDKTYVYMGDRWRAGQLADSRYVWLPITIDEAEHVASITYTTGWKLDATTGGVELPEVYLVSRGKPAVITNNDSVSGIEKTVDGIAYNLRVHGDSTHYFGGLTAPYEYTIDLGAVYDLSRIDVAYRLYNGSEMYHRYEILASKDQEDWTLLADRYDNTWAGFTSDQLNGRYRYVKLKVNEVRRVNNNALSNDWGSGLVEVEIYAHSPEPYVLTPPIADLESGKYPYPQTVTLSHPASDVRIYYTLDGSEPDLTSRLYTEAITLPLGESILRAIAVVDDEVSSVLEKHYELELISSEEVHLMLSGASQVSPAQVIDVIFGVETVTQSVYGYVFTVNYDPAQLEYTAAEPLEPEFTIIDGSVVPGQIKFRAVDHLTKVSPRGSADLLKLQFIVQEAQHSVTGSVYLSDLMLTEVSGRELGLASPVPYHYELIVVVDRSALAAAIDQAQTLHDDAEEGQGIGQYPPGSKAILLAAIEEARGVLDELDATQADVDLALKKLKDAMQVFTDSVITEQPGWGPIIVPSQRPVDAGYNMTINGSQVLLTTAPDEQGRLSIQLLASDLKAAFKQLLGADLLLSVESAEGPGVREIVVDLPLDVLREATEGELRTLSINAGLAQIQFEIAKLIKGLSGEQSVSSLQVTVQRVDPSELPEGVLEGIGMDAVVCDFRLMLDGLSPLSFAPGEVRVLIPYTLDGGEAPHQIVVYHLTDDGRLEIVKNSNFDAEAGAVSFRPNHLSMYFATYANQSFRDLDEAEWARVYIEAMGAREVIRGVGDDRFAPNDQLTRAEFVTMLIRLFDLIDPDAASSFTDVRPGSWYYDAVASAEQLGILTGRGDGTFGVNDVLSRQDMAVILYRTTQALGWDWKVAIEDITFVDRGEIAGYAYEAVAAMQQSGMILGVGGQRFAPLETSSRAQAAAVLYRLLATTF